VVDEPQGFSNSIPAVREVTSPEVTVVRLHGRNRATWNKKGLSAAERFNYFYSEDELNEFVGPVQRSRGATLWSCGRSQSGASLPRVLFGAVQLQVGNRDEYPGRAPCATA
jgi:hypothetical protein